MKLVKVSEFFLLYVSYSILLINNLKYFVLQQKLVLVSSVTIIMRSIIRVPYISFLIVVKALWNALRGRHKYGAKHEVNIALKLPVNLYLVA